MNLEEIVVPLLTWYDREKRSMPWRDAPNPYHTWLSEIMLQQTRVEAVRVYFDRFTKRLPTIQSLAEVSDDELLKLWEGLGYYNRARNLKKSAQLIMENHHGIVPDTYDEILALKGIGSYTAGAILSIAFGKKYPAVDGNVLRVFARLLNDDTDITDPALKKRREQEIKAILPERVGDFNQALMDLGAMLCLPNGMPKCLECPLAKYCQAWYHQTVEMLPVKKAKAARKIEKRTVFLVQYKDKVWIQKRDAKGLLSSLYEFPNYLGEYSIKEVKTYLENHSIKVKKVRKLSSCKHVFSHIEWHMTGIGIELEEILPNQLFVTLEAVKKEYSIPAAFEVYKTYLEQEVRSHHEEDTE